MPPSKETIALLAERRRVGAQGLAALHLCPDAQRGLSLRLQQPLRELLHLAAYLALRGA